MSPLKGILVSGLRRAPATSVRGAVACAALLVAFTFACRGAEASPPADARAPHASDARRAEKVLAKLRLLHEAADAGDANAYRALASKLYPDLFVRVAEIRAGDLSTDLSTAVFLADKLGRTWAAAGEATLPGSPPLSLLAAPHGGLYGYHLACGPAARPLSIGTR